MTTAPKKSPQNPQHRMLDEIRDLAGHIERNAKNAKWRDDDELSESLTWLRNDTKEILRLIEKIEEEG